MRGLLRYILERLAYKEIKPQKNVICNYNFPGTYVLLIKIEKHYSFRNWHFYPGIYAYVGSAKKGLSSRLLRHISRNKKLFWHIDYLLDFEFAYIASIYITNKFIENKTAKILEIFYKPIFNFGNSDDKKVLSHLFRIG